MPDPGGFFIAGNSFVNLICKSKISTIVLFIFTTKLLGIAGRQFATSKNKGKIS
jgi:L-cystine uptake protein TcyP (sodium:dicarboxylate symporter family)